MPGSLSVGRRFSVQRVPVSMGHMKYEQGGGGPERLKSWFQGIRGPIFLNNVSSGLRAELR